MTGAKAPRRMRKIWGIKGGVDAGYEPMAMFDGIRAGYVWAVNASGPIIDLDDDKHRVMLKVEGYPEIRSGNENGGQIVMLELRRAGAKHPDEILIRLQVRLIDLAEHPSIAASEWEEIQAEEKRVETT